MARGLRRGPVLLRFRSLVDSVAHYVAGIVDARQLSKVRYTLRDCYLSGLALFFVQDASLLQFQRRFQRKFQANNLSSTFGVSRIPCDSQFRDLIDRHLVWRPAGTRSALRSTSRGQPAGVLHAPDLCRLMGLGSSWTPSLHLRLRQTACRQLRNTTCVATPLCTLPRRRWLAPTPRPRFWRSGDGLVLPYGPPATSWTPSCRQFASFHAAKAAHRELLREFRLTRIVIVSMVQSGDCINSGPPWCLTGTCLDTFH